MACLFLEGFDKYSPVTNSALNSTTLQTKLTQNEWTGIIGGLTFSSVTALSATGCALKISVLGVSSLFRTLATSYSRLIGGFRFTLPVGTNAGVAFSDSGTAQCSVLINSIGKVELRRGTVVGTVVDTSTTTVASNTTHYLEFDLTFSNTGAYAIYLDGISILSGTGDLTTTANNSANQFLLQVDSTGIITYDDIYLFDTSGSFCNALLLTSPRVETQFPTGDSSVQFAFGAGILGTSFTDGGTSTSSSANVILLRKFTPQSNATISSVSFTSNTTNASAKFKAVIYSNSSNTPNTLLSSGTEVIGITLGATATGPLVTPQALTSGTAYWIGIITDTATSFFKADETNAGSAAVNTYASGAPATAPAMTAGQSSWVFWGNLTASNNNWSELDNLPSDGDLSFVSSSTVANKDLYSFPTLSVIASNIYVVGVKVYGRNSDAGARTIKVDMKSGTTDTASSALSPGTSYAWLDNYYETDPNTSTTWTYSGINAATSGFDIAS